MSPDYSLDEPEILPDARGETAIQDSSRERQIALWRWDNEGGAGPDGPQERSGYRLAAPRRCIYAH
jgi:hypothetical protein